MILPAQTIRTLGLLSPCEEKTVFNGCSYGIDPAGYSLRLAADIWLWPGNCVLVDAIEQFNMPNDIQGKLYTKSTWARMHVRVANTIIDPGFRGILRLELAQHFGEPVTILAGTGVAFVEFARLESPTEMPYDGKYQDQRAGQNAIFERGE